MEVEGSSFCEYNPVVSHAGVFVTLVADLPASGTRGFLYCRCVQRRT
jgi:hypothetical protein